MSFIGKKDQKETRGLIPIGLLRGRVAKKDFFYRDQYYTSIFYVAPQFGLQLVLFTDSDVNFETNTVMGTILKEGKPEQCIIPIPGVVDNFNFFGNDFYTKINERTFLTRDWIGRVNKTKQKDYEELLADGRFTDILIPSNIVDSFEDITQAFDEFNNIIVKPARGTEGELVIHITREKDCYRMTEDTEHFVLNHEELIEYYNENIGNKHFKFIVQPFIKSVTKYGEPFDIRVSARKGAGGKYVVKHFARVGNPLGIVSNYATGGYTMPIESFLDKYYEKDTQIEIRRKLDQLGEEFPEYYVDTLYKGLKLYDIGLDIGITNDKNGIKLWLFEVNSRGLGGFIYGLDEQIAQCQYYKFLADGLELKPTVIETFKTKLSWPVEPQYKPTVHDYYACNNGDERAGYLTHKNEKVQIKNYSTLTSANNYGFNIIAVPGTNVEAAADGRVVCIKEGFKNNGTEANHYGNYVVLRHYALHMQQPVYSVYGYLSNCLVEVGDMVKVGDVIGLSGNSGGSRIPCLHFAIRIGENIEENSVDPLELLPYCDFESLSDKLTIEDGFPESSIELYNSIMERGWDYIVKVKTAIDIPIKLGAKKVIPVGAVLNLASRTNDEAAVLYDSLTVRCQANDLIYIF